MIEHDDDDYEVDGFLAARILRSGCKLSDEQYKVLEKAYPTEVAQGFLALGIPYSAEELMFIDACIPKENKYKYDVKDGKVWRNDVLNGYMKHIRNYHYQYKPEAMTIDSDIDPNEEHIGPMAQDIEKVNPACIEETPEGVKTVDTGRLALMNAGAIAELAREIVAMKAGA